MWESQEKLLEEASLLERSMTVSQADPGQRVTRPGVTGRPGGGMAGPRA